MAHRHSLFRWHGYTPPAGGITSLGWQKSVDGDGVLEAFTCDRGHQVVAVRALDGFSTLQDPWVVRVDNQSAQGPSHHFWFAARQTGEVIAAGRLLGVFGSGGGYD